MKFKFPKAIGVCADRLYTLQQNRLKIQKQVAELEAEEKALREHIINTLPKSQASGVAGKIARVTVVNKEIPVVNDWPKFYSYVKKNNAFDLMQRRLSTGAINERMEAGVKIPGVDKFVVTSISLNKV